MKIELTEEQKKNLLVLLGRVNLTGNEVPTYLNIIKAINQVEKAKEVEVLKEENKG